MNELAILAITPPTLQELVVALTVTLLQGLVIAVVVALVVRAVVRSELRRAQERSRAPTAVGPWPAMSRRPSRVGGLCRILG